jgi:hypothetical protein
MLATFSFAGLQTEISSNIDAILILAGAVLSFEIARRVLNSCLDTAEANDHGDIDEDDSEDTFDDGIGDETIAGRHAQDAWEDEHGVHWEDGSPLDE